MKLALTLPPRGRSIVDGMPVGVIDSPVGVMLVLDVHPPTQRFVYVDEPNSIPLLGTGLYVGTVTTAAGVIVAAVVDLGSTP